jgi:hypothetical protein
MSAPSFQYNLISILGENVALTPTGLAPSETTIVEFDRYYIPPDISGNEALLLKNTMREVFQNKLKKVIDTDSGEELDDKVIQAFPPCGEEEKALVLKSLVHRKAVLEQQLFNIGIKTPEELRAKINEMAKTKKDEALQGQDSMFARQLLVHYLRLKRFINAYNEQQYCIYLEDIAYGEMQQDLTDERVIELLKQFVFFVLQSHHPLDDYKKSDPTAPGFVSRLERHPLKDKFTSFMKTYKDNELPIPQAIASVLEATELSPEAMEDEIQRRVKKCREDILKKIQSIFVPTDSFWKRVKDKTDLDSVLDALLQYPQDLLVEIKTLEAEKAALESKRNTADQAKALLEQQKNALTKLVSDLQAQLTKEQGKDAQILSLTQERDNALQQLSARQKELDTLRTQCNDRVRVLEQRIQANESKIAELTADVSNLRTENERLKAIAEQATNDMKGLQTRLAEQTAKTKEQETARVAAEQSALASANSLATKIEELARAKAEVSSRDETIQARDRDIEALRKQLQTQETDAGKVQAALKACQAEYKALNEQFDLQKGQIASLQEQIRTLSQAQTDSKTEDESNKAELATLRTQLADATRKAGDLEIQIAAAKKEVEDLRGSVTGSKADTAKLTAALEAANLSKEQAVRERDDAIARIKSLEVALADSQEEAKKQTGLVAERDTALKAKQGEVDAKANEEAAQRKRAEAAEAKVEEVEAAKDALETSMGEQLAAVQTSLTQKFEGDLAKAKEEFDAALESQRSDLGSVAGKAKEAHQMLRDVVLAVASDTSTPESIAALGDVPEKGALDSIVSRLAAAAKPSTPLAELAERKKESNAVMQCYFVFFTSFLWQSNFSTLIANQTSDVNYPREKQLYSIFQSIFETGPDPGDTAGTKVLGLDDVGLYAKKTKDKLLKSDIIKDYFRIIQTLTRAIETNDTSAIQFYIDSTKPPKLTADKKVQEETKLIGLTKDLIDQVNIIARVYAGKLLKKVDPPKAKEEVKPAKPSTYFTNKAMKAIYDSMNENEREIYDAKKKELLKSKKEFTEEDEKALMADLNAIVGPDFKPNTTPKTKEEQNKLAAELNAEIRELLGDDYPETSPAPVNPLTATTVSSVAARPPVPPSSPIVFVDFVKEYFQEHQPLVNADVVKRSIVFDGTNVKVGKGGNLTYPVLFYCFLMLMRDYLNTIENSGDQCKLPNFLKISSK